VIQSEGVAQGVTEATGSERAGDMAEIAVDLAGGEGPLLKELARGGARAGASAVRYLVSGSSKNVSSADFQKTAEVSARAFAKTGLREALAQTASPAALGRTATPSALARTGRALAGTRGSVTDSSLMKRGVDEAARRAMLDTWESAFRSSMAQSHAEAEALRNAGKSTMHLFHKAAGSKLGAILDPWSVRFHVPPSPIPNYPDAASDPALHGANRVRQTASSRHLPSPTRAAG